MKINRLVVISGPSAVGKSTFIRGLIDGEFNWVIRALGIEDLSQFTWVDPTTNLLRLRKTKLDKVVLHYDFIKRSHYDFIRRSYKGDPVFQIIRLCPHISWLTLWAAPEILMQRIEDRRNRIRSSISSLDSFIFCLKGFSDLLVANRRKRIYSNVSRLEQMYRNWFDATLVNPGDDHWVIDVNNLENPVVISRDRWLHEG